MHKPFIFLLGFLMFSSEVAAVGKQVSIEQLITSPENYKEKEVEVIGFIQHKPGYPYLILYNSKESALLKNHPNSVSLINDPKKGALKDYCSNRYVSLNGIVKTNRYGVFIEVKDYIQPFDKDFSLAYRTCEPTDNQIKVDE